MKQNKNELRQLWRQTQLIHQRYRPKAATMLLPLDGDCLEPLLKIQNTAQVIAPKNWGTAMAHLRAEHKVELLRLQNVILTSLQQHSSAANFHASPIDIFRDLTAVSVEFNHFKFEPVGMLLSIVTEPVELEGTWLGCFRISLDVSTLSRSERAHYDVVALDPYPASSDEEVVHPHVQSQRLCEGDAQSAIRLALCQGRLFDFFQLVDNVLRTYNSESAYVTLDDWGDLTCCDCGHLTISDDCCECSACEDRVCDGCWCCCTDCDQRHCSACNVDCSGCLDDVCKSCVNSCTECSENFCSSCLPENQRCNSCEDQESDKPSTEEDDIPTESGCESGQSRPEVHANGLGQATISA